MVGCSFHLVILRTTGLVIFLASVATVSAQPSSVPAPAPSEAAADDDAETVRQGSNNSFTLVRRQSIIQGVEIARDAIARGEYLSALPVMERILAEPNSFVPSGPSSEVSAHEDVRRLMRQMPTGMRQRLDEQRRSQAIRAWDQARSNGIVEVSEFAQQFGDLPLGVDAWWWIGCYERDHGHAQLAASAFLRMSAHPHATNQQSATALIAAAESFQVSQQPPQADRLGLPPHQQQKPLTNVSSQVSQHDLLIDRLTEMDSKLLIGIGGRSLTVGQWLAEHHAELSTPTNGGLTHRSSEIAKDRLRRPISQPTWKHPVAVPLMATLNAQEQKQRDQGIRPISILRPLVERDQVIVRTLDAIHAFGQSSGDDRWSIPNTEYRKIDSMRLFDNAAYQPAATDWAQRRTQADSIFSRMSTDRQRLFVIQEPDRGREFRFDREFPRVLYRSGPLFNKLCAYSLDSGELAWEIGGAATGASDTFGGCFFCGCPLIVDDILFVISQLETQVQLQAIDPENGSLKWSVALGSVLLPIAEDLQRSRVACPIVWNEGLLLCSTGAGAIVAVDPLLRMLKWAYRYPATTISAGDLIQGQNPANVRLDHEPWWDMWREPFANIAFDSSAVTNVVQSKDGSKASTSPLLIFASPETDHLHAIRLPEGEMAWRIPRSGGLMVVGIVDDLVIVFEGDFLRAHNLGTGQQRWRTMTGEISGPGAIVGSVIVLPAQSGGTVLLNAATGQLLSDSSSVDTPLGSLTEVSTGWIACSRQSVMRLPKLDDVRHGIEEQLAKEPENESLRVQAAFLDLQAGETVSARGRLDGLQTSPARELRREALIEALREPDGNRSDSDRSDLARQLKELAEDIDFKFAADAAIGTSSLAVADLVTAVDAALDGLTAELDQPEALVKSSSVIARKDRVLLGMIEEAYRRANATDLPAINERIAVRVKEARRSRDRYAVQRLAQQWRGLDCSRQLVVQEEERVLRKLSPTEVEFRLLDAAGSADPSIALQALEKLAVRFDQPSTRQDSRAVRRRILREFPSTKFFDGTTESERIARDPRLRDIVFARQKPEWPPVDPQVEILDDRNFGVSIVPMHAEPGSLAERLDVLIDRQGTEVLFRGVGFFQYGQNENHERKIVLPPSASPYRGPAGYMLREAWGIGRIVILLAGTELFAISPLDDRGEPNPRFLWANPIQLQGSPSFPKVVWHVAFDQSNRPIGKVGPVRAGYLCVQKGSKLVAVETETGRELWERLDLPKDSTILGDDHRVFIWTKSEVLEVLSAIDGRKLEDRVWQHAPASMIHNRGGLVWTKSSETKSDDGDARIELHDLLTGLSVWSRTEPKNTQVAVLDPETLAIAIPNGQLHLLAARTGEPICDPLQVDTEKMNGIATWTDSDRWYIAVARPTSNLSRLRANQPNTSYRLRYLSGKLYAVDREQPKIVWKRELLNEPIPLDQSVIAPVMVQIWKLVPKDDKSPSESLLRVTDKRTGRMLVDPDRRQNDLYSYFLLNPDPQQGIVELKLVDKTIRLTYASEQPADAVEAIQKVHEDHRVE